MKKRHISSRKSRYYLPTILTCLLLILSLPVTLLALRKQQIVKQQAQTTTPACISTLPIKVPVVVLGYFPPAPNDPTHLDPTETGWTQQNIVQYGSPGGKYLTITDWENNVNQMAAKMSQVVSNDTRYHGYKDPSAPMFLNYQVIDTKFFTQPIPHSTMIAPGEQAVRPDYNKVLTSVNVCNYVDNLGVKEFWIYGYHSNLVSPDESRLSSKYGDVSNSSPHEKDFPPQDAQYKLPVCNNSYIMYNFAYWPDPNFIDNTVHNRMHQIENEMGYAEDSTSWPPTAQNTSGTMFWGNFAQFVQAGDVNTPKNSCANTHFALNWQTANDEYKYNLQNMQQSNCETWNPDPTKSTYKPINCTAWGCTALGWYNYWMQNIPGYNNGIVYQGKPMRNWWEAMYDFNTFISKGGRTLLGNSNLTCPTTPAPTANPAPSVYCLGSCPTPEPTPTPTLSGVPTSTLSPILHPCTNTQSVTTTLQTANNHHSKHKHHDNDDNSGGLAGSFLELIEELLQLIEQLLGSSPGPNPSPNPTPSPSAIPSSAPCPSTTPTTLTPVLSPIASATPPPIAPVRLTITPVASSTPAPTPTLFATPTISPIPTFSNVVTPTIGITPVSSATPTLFAVSPATTPLPSFNPSQILMQSPQPTNTATPIPTTPPVNGFAAQILQFILGIISLILKFFASLFR